MSACAGPPRLVLLACAVFAWRQSGNKYSAVLTPASIRRTQTPGQHRILSTRAAVGSSQPTARAATPGSRSPLRRPSRGRRRPEPLQSALVVLPRRHHLHIRLRPEEDGERILTQVPEPDPLPPGGDRSGQRARLPTIQRVLGERRQEPDAAPAPRQSAQQPLMSARRSKRILQHETSSHRSRFIRVRTTGPRASCRSAPARR